MPSPLITIIVGLLCVVSVFGYGYTKGKLLRGSGGIGFNSGYLGYGQLGGPYLGLGHDRQYNGIYGGSFSKLYGGYGSYGGPYGVGECLEVSIATHHISVTMVTCLMDLIMECAVVTMDTVVMVYIIMDMIWVLVIHLLVVCSHYGDIGYFSGFGFGGGNLGYKKTCKGIVYLLSKYIWLL